MEKLIVFGSDKCPDCPPALEELDNKNIDYEFINITESIPNLKRFLLIRDNNPEFDKVKNNGSVGIPCFYKDGNIFFNIEDIL
ncbi:MAG: glutaredoxin domain-containing protein [Miniphocaeibacter sp.]|uniref:glutaredoxin domain-containing protein n=1 Tax=Miniphocaeibacter sp. TaxID=3100973 RepID=UPI0017AFC9AA|nr:hypothetical protein [Gallicola sp.]